MKYISPPCRTEILAFVYKRQAANLKDRGTFNWWKLGGYNSTRRGLHWQGRNKAHEDMKKYSSQTHGLMYIL